jgi:hypothetical protein
MVSLPLPAWFAPQVFDFGGAENVFRQFVVASTRVITPAEAGEQRVKGFGVGDLVCPFATARSQEQRAVPRASGRAVRDKLGLLCARLKLTGVRDECEPLGQP